MSLIRSLKDKVEGLKNDLCSEIKRLKNKALLEGILAACALVANANGIIKPEEKRKMMGFIKREDALSVYDTGEVIKIFEKVYR